MEYQVKQVKSYKKSKRDICENARLKVSDSYYRKPLFQACLTFIKGYVIVLLIALAICITLIK